AAATAAAVASAARGLTSLILPRRLVGYSRPMPEERASRFDHFVEAAHAKVSRAPFFAVCVAAMQRDLGVLLEHPPQDGERRVRGWHATVDRALQQDLGDLVGR